MKTTIIQMKQIFLEEIFIPTSEGEKIKSMVSQKDLKQKKTLVFFMGMQAI